MGNTLLLAQTLYTTYSAYVFIDGWAAVVADGTCTADVGIQAFNYPGRRIACTADDKLCALTLQITTIEIAQAANAKNYFIRTPVCIDIARAAQTYGQSSGFQIVQDNIPCAGYRNFKRRYC